MLRRAAVGLLLLTTLVLTGCIRIGLWSETSDPAVPRSPEVRARSAAVRPALVQFADQQVAGRRLLASGAQDGCEEGQNNWKVETGWQWQCTRRELRVVEGGPVESGLRRQHQLLLDAGCRIEVHDGFTFDVEYLLQEYWQRYRHNSPWESLEPGLPPRPYTPKDLPSLRYLCADGLQVEIKPSDRSEEYYLEYPPPWSLFLSEVIELTVPSSTAERQAIKQSRSPLHLWIVVSTDYYVE
jgi:hypothetical protein